MHSSQLPTSTYWPGRRVALTGASGFVGYHLAQQLTQAGALVSALVRPSSQVDALRRLGVRCVTAPVEDVQALTHACQGQEILFHLAGAVDFRNDWERFERVNVQGTAHVIEAAKSAGVGRLIFTSSIVTVHAAQRPEPVNEAASWNLAEARVPYITTKRQAEDLVLAESSRGLDAVVVNPGSIIGPDDFSGSEFGILCKRFWKRRVPFYFSGGNSFVDVRDVAQGHLLAAEKGVRGERYLLSGTNRTYAQFFADLALLSPRYLPRLPLPNWLATWGAKAHEWFAQPTQGRAYLTTGQARLLGRYFFFDSTKASEQLGYSCRPYQDTLADTYRYWLPPKSAQAG